MGKTLDEKLQSLKEITDDIKMLDEKYKIVVDILEKNDQMQLLTKYNSFKSFEQKNKLLDQILSIDFDLAKKLYKKAILGVDFEDIEITPVDYVEKSKIPALEKDSYRQAGIDIIKDNEFAVITLSGGQGTRLGHKGPKGTFILENGKSLFELLCDHLKDAVNKYNTFIHWYIMTSEENHDETVEFFEKNNYFDYPKNYVTFFVQGKFPMIGKDGQILLDTNGFVKEASDGHGGVLNTLEKTGLLKHFNEKNYKWIFISGVDNVLANLVDPLLVGFGSLSGSKIVVKSVEKTDPKENVGVFCKKNGKIGVIEYTEVTEKMANLRDDYGSLVYGDSNALLNLYSIEALNSICDKKLPYHVALKKANYLDKNGEVVKATEPNAFKFESFIFDSLEMMDDVTVFRVQREDEFAPLKNAHGVDSPETAKKLYNDFLLKKQAYDNYYKWLADNSISKEDKKILEAMKSMPMELKDAFYKDLDFGTAGLRGQMGLGTNRMNEYTVTKATQGLANYIISVNAKDRGVVICYDTRNNSYELAHKAALCMNANGIKVFLTNKPYPVPMLAYSVRALGAVCGIMITASHNPPQYNGYKVYWEHGGQIISPQDQEIISHVRKIRRFSEVKTMPLEKALASKLLIYFGPSVERLFLKEIQKLQLHKDDISESKKDISVIYTPLHGTGLEMVTKNFETLGYENVFVVPEQELPNGNFPTVAYPNPEEPSAFALSLKYANKFNADICLATDPDCDRIGSYIYDQETGQYVRLTGNEMATIMMEYLLSTKYKDGTIPKNPVCIGTIVSTKITAQIAKEYGVEYLETLTGFKYMGNLIKEYEKTGEKNFLFGFEESFGFLYGDLVRDKDGIAASMLLLEAAAYYKTQDLTLVDVLENIYKKYGYYLAKGKVIVLKGQEGEVKISKIMERFRNNPPKEFAGKKVLEILDYKKGTRYNLDTEYIQKLDLPESNVLIFKLEDGCQVAVRPSGTEPKIKFYFEAVSNNRTRSQNILDKIEKEINAMVIEKEDKSTLNYRKSNVIDR